MKKTYVLQYYTESWPQLRRGLWLMLTLLYTALNACAQTAPVIGTTSFTGLGTTPYASAQASPATASNVGGTGWDFTGIGTTTLNIGSIAGATTGLPGAQGGGDPFIRTNRSTSTGEATETRVKANNGAAFRLTSLYLENAITAQPQTMTLTGYKAGVAVSGATLAQASSANYIWVKYDVSSNTAFNNIDEFRVTVTNNNSASRVVIGVDEITIAAPVLPATVPTVTTTAPTSVASTSATLAGNVTTDGGASVTDRGVVYSSTNATPTTADTKAANGTGTGTFSATITGLAASTTYTVRAYATNSVGTSYGAGQQFTTTAAPAPDLAVSTGSASSPVTIAAGTYNSLMVTGSGYAQLGGAVVVNTSATVQGGGTLLTACQRLTGAGSFTLADGATLGICDASGISSTGATGAVQVAGTRSFSTDALYTYNGTAAQVTGSGLPATVRSLTLNNAAGLTATSALTATASATLTSGGLALGAATLTLGPAATLSETASGYATGTVQTTRSLATAGATESFGGMGLTLTPSGSTLPGSTLVRRVTGTALTGVGTSQSVRRYFDIQPTTQTGLNVALVLTARDDERNGIAPANLRLFKSDNSGSTWQPQGAATYATATTGGLTTYSASLGGISNFSIWTLGDAANPLPVELIAFTAQNAGVGAVQLSWATASEQHSARFEVERSLDGRVFTLVGQVAARGNSLTTSSYTYRDALLPSGATQVYYRLRQVDLDGTASYSPVRALVAGGGANGAALMLFPNPAHGRVQWTGPAEAPAQLLDLAGRCVRTAPAGAGDLDLAGIPAGVYLLRCGTQSAWLAVE